MRVRSRVSLCGLAQLQDSRLQELPTDFPSIEDSLDDSDVDLQPIQFSLDEELSDSPQALRQLPLSFHPAPAPFAATRHQYPTPPVRPAGQAIRAVASHSSWPRAGAWLSVLVSYSLCPATSCLWTAYCPTSPSQVNCHRHLSYTQAASCAAASEPAPYATSELQQEQQRLHVAALQAALASQTIPVSPSEVSAQMVQSDVRLAGLDNLEQLNLDGLLRRLSSKGGQQSEAAARFHIECWR